MRLILASASPRRRELLARLGFRFEVRPVDIDETPRPDESEWTLAGRLAERKAASVPGDDAVLAADTVVAVGGTPLGKPADAAEAAAMLGRLAGRDHLVVTAVALRIGGGTSLVAVGTRVWFRAVSPGERDAYAARGESLDAAGAYAIQGAAAAFVTRIVGSYTNVVGLPLAATGRVLAQAGLPH